MGSTKFSSKEIGNQLILSTSSILFNMFNIAGLCKILSLHFTVFIHFEEY